MRLRQTSAVLSLCLPGLGQLYQRRPGVTLAVFAVFAALLLGAGSPYFLPLWAALAGWEALQHELSLSPDMVGWEEVPGRRRIFATFGILGFVFWFSLAAGSFFPTVDSISKHP